MKVPESTFKLCADLPGEELIVPGLRDLERGSFGTIEALLILIARTRLIDGGLSCLQELNGNLPENPEEKLYELLSDTIPDDTYGRYNSLKRKLTSFASALSHRTHHLSD